MAEVDHGDHGEEVVAGEEAEEEELIPHSTDHRTTPTKTSLYRVNKYKAPNIPVRINCGNSTSRQKVNLCCNIFSGS